MEEQGFLESRYEMERLLQEEKVGYLGLSLDEKPYVVPLNYHYSEGRISGSTVASEERSWIF